MTTTEIDPLAEIDRLRISKSLCRHCGGPTPCWSSFGDREPGKRHTRKSFAQAKQGASGQGAAFIVNKETRS